MNVAIKDSVATEFAQVDDVIVELLQSDVEMVENIGHYIVKAGGKRMRPLLVLLSAKALGWHRGCPYPLCRSGGIYSYGNASSR